MPPNTRDLVKKNEGKLTVLQIIGFWLLILGVAMIVASCFYDEMSSTIAVAFFLTMLGFAFTFPSMLENNEGLSTMRIVVFMTTNVFCMLLLKLGWAPTTKSLHDIGLDGYWMGLIAFAFGAKATQTYFESKLAVPGLSNMNRNPVTTTGTDSSDDLKNLPLADETIITEALKEKGKEWVNSFPNASGVSVMNKTSQDNKTKNPSLVFKVTKKIDEMEYGAIPQFLKYRSKNGVFYRILTDVVEEQIPESYNAIIQDSSPFPLGNSVSRDGDVTGSIGLVVKKIGSPDYEYIVSCYHVFCAPELRSNNRTFPPSKLNSSILVSSVATNDNGTNLIGSVIQGAMDGASDFAVAKLNNNNYKVDRGTSSLGTIPKVFGYVFPEDKGTVLKVCGRTSGVDFGKVKSHSAGQTILYCNKTISQFYDRLIEVEPFSKGGDSGGVVINQAEEVVGLIIAGNTTSSYVLPVEQFLLDNNYSL